VLFGAVYLLAHGVVKVILTVRFGSTRAASRIDPDLLDVHHAVRYLRLALAIGEHQLHADSQVIGEPGPAEEPQPDVSFALAG